MRILFITRKFPPSTGGMETYSQCLYAAMVAAGADIDLIKPAPPIIGRPSLVAMLRFMLGAAWRVIRRARDYDVVLLGDFAIAALAPLVHACGRGRCRIVVALHGNDLYFRRQRGVKPTLYRCMCNAVVRSRAIDMAIANSTAIQNEATTCGLRNTIVIPLATSIPDAALSARHNDERIILFTGRLIRYKGLAWFVETVWPLLDAAFKLHVAGPVWDTAEVDCLRNRPRVTYLGELKRDELPLLRSQAIVCIMPNLPPTDTEQNEGFGLAALESAAVGTPVVAARVGGLAEAVVDGVTGFLVEPLDARAFAQRINTIAGWTAEQRAQFAAHARETIADRFTWERVARDYLREFARLTRTPVDARPAA